MSDKQCGENNPAKRPEVKLKISKRTKENWSNHEVRQKRLRTQKETWSSFSKRQEQSQSIKEAWKDPVKRKNMADAIKEAMNKSEVKSNCSIAQIINMNKVERKQVQQKYMLDGGALYAQSFIKNPSKPQIELFKKAQLICPYSILNYPDYFTGYCIDVAIPKLGIAIEYDGYWFHKDQEKDLARQKKLEEQGWRFLRYKDCVPTLQNLAEDILRLSLCP